MSFVNWLSSKFKENTPVVSVILLTKDGEGLLLRRGKTAPSYAGYWNFPGGHIEKNEAPEEGAVRECEEETGITPQNLTFLGPKQGYVTYFKAFTDNKSVKLGTNWGVLENDSYAWVDFEDYFKYNVSDMMMDHYWYVAHGKEPPKPKKPMGFTPNKDLGSFNTGTWYSDDAYSTDTMDDKKDLKHRWLDDNPADDPRYFKSFSDYMQWKNRKK